MEVEVAADNGFDLGERRVVYSTPNLYGWSFSNSYAVDADDSRFLVIRQRGGADDTQLIVWENFFEVLRNRIPR